MQKEYVFKINSTNISDDLLSQLKTYLDLNSIEYGFEEIKLEEINCIKPILFFYTNGYSDNCVGFNNIVDIDRFIEVYPTITPMYSFNVVDGFELIHNYVGKELTDEIISYCKKVYHDKSK
jgi:hypothetical protein